MKPVLIVMSHGNMAREALESAKFITGEIENAVAISMEMEDGLNGTRVKLETALKAVPEGAKVLIVTDIPGGTPCNAAVETLFSGNETRVIAGLNLGMLIEYALSSDEDIDKLCSAVCESGAECVQIIKKPEGNIDGDGVDE